MGRSSTSARVKGVALALIAMFAGSMAATIYFMNILPDGQLIVLNPNADVGESVTFQITDVAPNTDRFILDFHDGSGAIELENNYTFTHSFPFEGLYNVTMVMVSSAGLTKTVNTPVHIQNQQPTVTFEVSPPPLIMDNNITLSVTNISLCDTLYDISTLLFQWRFGDGTTGTGSRVNHTYTAPGEYAVACYVADDQGAVGYSSNLITIMNQHPVANFTLSPSSTVPKDSTIFLNGTLSVDSPSDIGSLHYFWDLGDGEVAEGSLLFHRYIDSGEVNISLTVQDPWLGSNTTSQIITILNQVPYTTATSSHATILEGDTAQYKVQVEDEESDNPRLTYSWDFGANSSIATRRVPDEGLYLGQVTVQDPAGATSTSNASVTALNTNPVISLTSLSLVANLSLRMTGTPHIENAIGFRVLVNGHEYGTITIGREPGNPDEQRMTWPGGLSLDLSQDIQFEAFYCNINGSFPIFQNVSDWRDYLSLLPFNHTEDYIAHGPANGTVGANPLWVILTFPDGRSLNWSNTLVASNPSTWNWTIPVKDFLANYTWTIGGYVYDRGMDALSASIQYGSNSYKFSSSAVASPSNLPFSFSLVPNIGETISFTAWDEDGGFTSSTAVISAKDGQPILANLAPRITLDLPGTVIEEENQVLFNAKVTDYNNLDLITDLAGLTFTWNYGDGVIDHGMSGGLALHSWAQAGEYLLQVIVSDGNMEAAAAVLVVVTPIAPVLNIYGLPSALEDQVVDFQGVFYDTPLDIGTMRLVWNFGDGSTATGNQTTHAWHQAGTYTVTLSATDDSGVTSTYLQAIEILEVPPSIGLGFLGFEAIEGERVNFDFNYADSIIDYRMLSFTWVLNGTTYIGVNPNFRQFPGTYTGYLRLQDADGVETMVNVTINILNSPPMVTASNYIFFAPSQPIELNAYGMDVVTLDETIQALNFTWYIGGTTFGSTYGLQSTISWTPPHSGIFDARVTVCDVAGVLASRQFMISAFIDTDGDGIHDELEVEGNTDPANEDSDGDFLSDYYEIHFTGTSPYLNDTDGDGLFDGADATGVGEAVLGTNPNFYDTDGDMLPDGFEVTGWEIWVQEAGQNKTLKPVSSDPLLVDTDGDRLNDSAELEQGTDPRLPDTDGDGVSDFWQSPYGAAYDFDMDGISDVDETTGYFYWANGVRLHATSDPNANDTDCDNLPDWEERYPGQDGYVTAADMADTDGDGLNESIEWFTKTETFGQRAFIPGDNAFHTFQVSASFGSYINNVSLTVGVSTGEESEPEQDNSATIEAKVTYGTHEFSLGAQSNVKYYFVSQNLSDIIEANQGNGLWLLDVKASKPALLDVFEIYGVMPLNPTSADSDGDGLCDGREVNASLNSGWMTNPLVKDTDGDGWWDAYEINIRGTNPLDIDTDGDDVADPADINPLANTAIRVYVVWGHWADAGWFSWIDGANLQVVTTVLDRVVASPVVRTSADWVRRSVGIYVPGIIDFRDPWNPFDDIWGDVYWEWWAWWAATTSDFSWSSYSFDIPDNQRYVPMKTTLWDIYAPVEWAIGGELFTSTFSADVFSPGYYTPASGANYVQYYIAPFAIPRVHTVAVNIPTAFAGNRYNQPEHFDAFVFKVSGQSTHFVSGYNAALIPASLFVKTKLHSVLERAKENNTLLTENSVLSQFNFTGLDRDRPTTSKWLDAVISGLVSDVALTTAQAEELLTLLLTSANESEGIIFAAYATDQAEILGLPSDVLQVIPYRGDGLWNSAMGLMPRTLLGAIVEFFITIGLLLYGGLVFLVNCFIEFGKWVVGLFGEVIGAIAAGVMKLIEAVVKAAVLVLVYLLFALDLIAKLIFYAIVGISLFVLASAFGGTCSIQVFNPFSINASFSGFSIYFEDRYEWVQNSFLDMEIPAVRRIMKLGDKVLADSRETFLFGDVIEYSTDLPTESESTNVIGGEETTTKSVPSSNEITTSIKLLNRPNIAQTDMLNKPIGLTVTQDSNTWYVAKLDWGSVTGATEYRIYRNGVKVGTTSLTSFADYPIQKVNSYSVAAWNSEEGESEKSDAVSITLSNPSNPLDDIPILRDGSASLNWADKKINYEVYCRKSFSDWHTSVQLISKDHRKTNDPKNPTGPSVTLDNGWYKYSFETPFGASGRIEYNFVTYEQPPYYCWSSYHQTDPYLNFDAVEMAKIAPILSGMDIASNFLIILAATVGPLNPVAEIALQIGVIASVVAPLLMVIVPLWLGEDYDASILFGLITVDKFTAIMTSLCMLSILFLMYLSLWRGLVTTIISSAILLIMIKFILDFIGANITASLGKDIGIIIGLAVATFVPLLGLFKFFEGTYSISRSVSKKAAAIPGYWANYWKILERMEKVKTFLYLGFLVLTALSLIPLLTRTFS